MLRGCFGASILQRVLGSREGGHLKGFEGVLDDVQHFLWQFLFELSELIAETTRELM